jgi:mono/diheme cytochrome c family protein
LPILVAALLVFGCAHSLPRPSDASVAAARKAVPRGARIFNLYCAHCHGEEGNAPGIPPVMGPGALRAMPGRETALELFRYNEARMPPGGRAASGLDRSDYWAVTEYLVRVAQRPLSGPLDERNAASVSLSP